MFVLYLMVYFLGFIATAFLVHIHESFKEENPMGKLVPKFREDSLVMTCVVWPITLFLWLASVIVHGIGESVKRADADIAHAMRHREDESPIDRDIRERARDERRKERHS
jgi:hypothetical protein